MPKRGINWSVTLGLVAGISIGVVLSKSMDRFPTPVMAGGNEGRKVANEQAEIFRVAAKTIAPAVVNITTMQRVRYREGGLTLDQMGMPFYKAPRVREGLVPSGVGSGFVFDAVNGYIMTNNHVVKDGEAWVVRLADKREIEAKLVATDPQTDVAVLKIDAPNLVAATLGDSSKAEVGDWVLAVGNPFGLLEQSVTAGIISAKGRKGLNLSNYEDFLQTDAAINQGNSGGPLVNVDGEVIGVNTAIFSKSGGYQGIGFAIPINQARDVGLKLVKTGGSFKRGWMGVEVKDLDEKTLKNLALDYGASVEGVYLGGPARKAGMIPGDILISINSKPVRSGEDIRDLVADLEPGSVVNVTYMREAEKKTVPVTIGAQPKDWGVRKSANGVNN